MTVRFLPASAVCLWLLLQCPAAHADPAAAEALFREGRALLERGEIASACEKLEASHALDPSAGTLLNLAACRLKQGKSATAWAHFVSAERVARNQSRPEQATEAKRRADELEPQLSVLTLLAPDAPPGLEVRRQGQLVQPASLGASVPVDPGLIIIEASAPGFRSERLEVTIGASADRRSVTIPRLQRLETTGSPSVLDVAPPGPAASSGRGKGSLPWAIGGVGGGALIAGGVLGGLALSSNAKAIKACDAGDRSACFETQERRDGQALASTICVGVGLVAVSVATIWLLTGRSEKPPSAWSYAGEVTRESALFTMGAGF
jgi:hypothetical protein